MPRRFTFIVLLISFRLFSQPTNVEMLKSSLEYTPDDTSKVKILIELGKLNSASKYTTSLYYLQKAFSLASKLNYKKGIADTYHYFGRVYYYQDQYDVATEYYNKAKTIYKEINCKSGLAEYYTSIGQLEELYGNYTKAIKDFQNALKIWKKIGNPKEKALCYNNISNIHLEQKNLELALNYAGKAYRTQKKLGDARGLSIITTTMGKIYEEKNMLDSALNCYERALKLRINLKNDRLIASSMYLIGSLKTKTGETEAAITDLRKTLTTFKKLKDKTGIIISLLSLSDAFLQLNDFKSAKEKIDFALSTSTETNNQNLILSCYEQYIKLYDANHDFPKALSYQKKYQKLKDSLFNLEKTKIFSELEMRYQSKSKDNEIELLTVKNDIQKKNIIILALSAALLLIFAILLLYFIRVKSISLKRKAELLEREKIIHRKDNEIKENEKRFLQKQLDIKNKELTTKVMGILRANEMQENIINRLELLTKQLNNKPKAIKEVNAIINEMERQSEKNIWEEFDKTFQGIHTDFYSQLLNICPELTPGEIKIAALLKLNLRTKEIAALTFKSESGIKSTRYRLRKKLGLTSENSLVTFLIQL